MSIKNDIDRLRALLPHLPGVYLKRKAVSGTNAEGKAETQYSCIRGELTDEMIVTHFAGKQAYAVSPFRADGESCQWLAIDIDRYGIELDKLEAHIKECLPITLPLVPAKTKSGGWHLYLFLEEPAKSADLFILANKIRFWLNGGPLKLNAEGKGDQKGEIETRPAQSFIKAADGDVGSFLTLPLFNSSQEAREAWLKLAEDSRVPVDTINKLCNEGELEDGPCCLFPILKKAEAVGWSYRNMFCYQVAVFFHKKYPSNWKDKVREYVANNVDGHPPEEVEKTIQSIEKTGPGYICSRDPFEPVCNRSLCQRRRYGISAKGILEYVNADSMIVIKTASPTWFVTVRDGEKEERMKLTTEELLNQKLFKKRCVETVLRIPELPSPKEWEKTIMDWMSRAVEVPVPFSQTLQGILWDVVWQFFSCSSSTTNPEDIALGKILIESTSDDGSFAYFRLVDLSRYIERARVKLPNTDLFSLLKELEMGKHVQLAMVKLDGLSLEVWRVQIPDLYLMDKMETNLRGDHYE